MVMNYVKANASERALELTKLQREYEIIKEKKMKLNMARGNPSVAQLKLTDDMLTILDKNSDFSVNEAGVDARNYSILEGIPAARKLFGDILEMDPSQVIVGGNSSLNLMFDAISRAYTHGLPESETPWGQLPKVKFLCPVPGYDRHFRVTESFGMELVSVETDENGPNMEQVKKLVESDETIKGIWCVPRYTNPSGTVYSEEVVKAFARLKPKAKDFRIMWDNAYSLHHLVDEPKPLLNIYEECKKVGSEDMVYLFASTSKITYAGSGVSAIAASPKNIAHILGVMTVQTIGFDKVNQLRHVAFLKDLEHTKEHMKLHRAILKPKFNLVQETFTRHFGENPILKWTKPEGGYFVCAEASAGCAKKIVALCKEAGLILTGAGAPFPHGIDPKDAVIRIAPSFPPIEELKDALEVFCLCVKLVYLEKENS